MNTNKPAKNLVHIYLNDLINKAFGVTLEIHHTQFDDKNPGFSSYGKPIRARTAVLAYKTREDAIEAKKNPSSGVKPLTIAIAECSIKDSFNKRVGLTKALHRLYRNLAELRKPALKK